MKKKTKYTIFIIFILIISFISFIPISNNKIGDFILEYDKMTSDVITKNTIPDYSKILNDKDLNEFVIIRNTYNEKWYKISGLVYSNTINSTQFIKTIKLFNWYIVLTKTWSPFILSNNPYIQKHKQIENYEEHSFYRAFLIKKINNNISLENIVISKNKIKINELFSKKNLRTNIITYQNWLSNINDIVLNYKNSITPSN